MPHIVADDRERASGIPDLLDDMDDVELSVQRLPEGDYVIDGRVVIERKTLADFATSIVDTRLFRQASKLLRSHYRPAFLIEGRGETPTERRVSRAAIQGAMISLALVFDVPLLRSSDTTESARILAGCARQLATTPARGKASHWKPKTLRSRRLHVLSSLPGVGPDRAVRLLKAFGTVEECIKANEAALLQVEGIGTKTAAAIRQVLSTREEQ